MGLWLFKEEPKHYSFADLQRDGRTLWDGITNNLARKYLRQVRKGDRVLYYHTGKEKAVVAEMRVVADSGAAGEGTDAEKVAVEVVPVGPLKNAVTLARIKADRELAKWELVRLPRLSIVPVTPEQWRRIEEMSAQG
jgi:predicted RNA-binding protein with PUA-like domain